MCVWLFSVQFWGGNYSFYIAWVTIDRIGNGKFQTASVENLLKANVYIALLDEFNNFVLKA